jgi:pimeloyl-ACP methyl ester carboxylesterase
MENINDFVSHHYIEVNGIKLHVAKAGNGKKLVVLLHGWPEFWYTWRNQIPVLAEHFTVVAPDLRGFNLSDKPNGISNYKSDLAASDIAELIPKLGFDKAYIIGHDWGGAISWIFAALYPTLTEKLIILNCPHPMDMIVGLKKPSQMLKSWYILYHQLPLLPELIYRITLKLFFTLFMKGWMHNKQNFTEEDLNEFVNAYKQKGALKNSINYYRAMVQRAPNKLVFKNKIKSPTLLIWGKKDKALGIELSYGTHKHVNAPFELKYIENCSHWTQNDCPEEVNNYVLDFLLPKQ